MRVGDVRQHLAVEPVDALGQLRGAGQGFGKRHVEGQRQRRRVVRRGWRLDDDVVVGVVQLAQEAHLVRVVEVGGLLGAAEGEERRFGAVVVLVVVIGRVEPLLAVAWDCLP